MHDANTQSHCQALASPMRSRLAAPVHRSLTPTKPITTAMARCAAAAGWALALLLCGLPLAAPQADMLVLKL